MKRKYLNYRQLLALEFTNEEIFYLLKSNILFKSGILYSYQGIHELINSSYNLESPLNDKILNLCYFVEPDFYRVNLNLFAKCINNFEIEESLVYLRKLLNSQNVYALQDYNLYLLLISNIIDLPEDLKEKSRQLKEKNILLLDENNNLEFFETKQKIRKMIFAGKFKLAKQSITKFIMDTGSSSLTSSIISKLLYLAIGTRIEIESSIKHMLEEDKFEDALIYLERIKEKHSLSNMDSHIFLGIIDILEIKYLKKLPCKKIKPNKKSNENPYAAIENGEYRIAKSLLKGKAATNSLIETLISKAIEMMDYCISLSSENMMFEEEYNPNKLEIFKTLYNYGISIKSIPLILGFTKAERNMQLLYLSQKFYQQGDTQMCEEILDYVEKHSSHVKEVVELLNQIKIEIQNRKTNSNKIIKL